MTPTARSLAYLKKLGIPAGTVERWIPQVKRRVDLFNFADLVAIVPPGMSGLDREKYPNLADEWSGHILALQVTSSDNVASRVKKILAEPRAKLWLEAGGRICVHGWAKQGGKGKRKLWTLRTVQVTPADFEPANEEEPAEDPEFATPSFC